MIAKRLLLGLVAIIALSAIVGTGAIAYFNNTEKTTLYYGDGCSHCERVEQYIKNTKLDDQFIIDRKEVFNNKKNAETLLKKMIACKLPNTTEVSVPVLVDQGKCFLGDVDIIKYLSEKAAIRK